LCRSSASCWSQRRLQSGRRSRCDCFTRSSARLSWHWAAHCSPGGDRHRPKSGKHASSSRFPRHLFVC
jgi:hypothetical protein